MCDAPTFYECSVIGKPMKCSNSQDSCMLEVRKRGEQFTQGCDKKISFKNHFDFSDVRYKIYSTGTEKGTIHFFSEFSNLHQINLTP